MTPPRILLDIDGVLLDWLRGFRRYCRIRGILPPPRDPPTWHIGMLPEITAFNAHDDFSRIPAVTGAKSAIAALARAGCELHAITCCGKEVAPSREKNLLEVFGPVFSSVSCLPLGASKVRSLSRYPASWWVEDNLTHALDGTRCGHRSILLDRSYNQGPHEGVTRVKTWHQALKTIQNLV